MENILDAENKRSKTNYKKWSFRLFIYAIIANLTLAYKVTNFVDFFQSDDLLQSAEVLYRDVIILLIVIAVCLSSGLLLTFLSYRNNEERNYQYKFSIFGIPILTILSVLASVLLFIILSGKWYF